jgi:hypothetical protein
LPDGNLTPCFQTTSQYVFAVQESELGWTPPQQGKITRTPKKPRGRRGISGLSAKLAFFLTAGV